MKLTMFAMAIAPLCTLLACSSASPTGEETVDTVQRGVLGEETHLYFRCNATGFNPTPATRLTPTGTPGEFSLSYSVEESWMVSGFDHCSFTETNQLDGWGTWQGHYGADAADPIAVPDGGTVRVDGSDWFNVRYPELGDYTVTVQWPSGEFSIEPFSEDPNEPELPEAANIDELINTCPSAELLDAIDADLDLRFEYQDEDGDGDLDDPSPDGNTLVCTAAQGSRDLTRSEERVYQALIALKALDFEGLLPFTDLGLYDWLVESIDGIVVRSDATSSSCCSTPPGATGLYMTLQNSENRSYYSTYDWHSQSGLGLFTLAQLIVHEARHATGPGHCAGGSDTTIDALGSWGAVYHFSRAVAFDSDPCFVRPADESLPADLYLAEALEYSRTVHETRFCEEPTSPVEPPEPVTACAE